MQLYHFALSGNAYKVRLFAALLELELELVPVDLPARSMLFVEQGDVDGVLRGAAGGGHARRPGTHDDQ